MSISSISILCLLEFIHNKYRKINENEKIIKLMTIKELCIMKFYFAPLEELIIHPRIQKDFYKIKNRRNIRFV